jgi:hypothetical protein
MRSSKKNVTIGFGIVGSLVLIAIIAYIYHSVSVSLQAEETLWVNWDVLQVLQVYVAQNPGRWPESWEDLKKTPLPDQWRRSHYRWPEDINEFKKRVHIEFGLTLQEVAAMVTPEQVAQGDFSNFTAVQPIGPNYGPCEGELGHLMKVVWEQNSKAKQEKPHKSK